MRLNINKELSAKFLRIMKESPDKTAKVIRVGLRRCGDQLRNQAAQKAPYLTGNLKRSITMQFVGEKTVMVGTNLEYARIHDEGGVIYPKKSNYLRFKIGGQWVTVKKVTIPKYRGEGYLTPAFNQLVDGDAEKIFMEEIQRAIS